MYVTSLGCLCPKPPSFEIFGCKSCVCLSPFLPQFQVWPSKSRHFCLQSIDSERKRKEHTIISSIKWDVDWLKPGKVLFRIENNVFAREEYQGKVKSSRELKRYVSQNISGNSWNSTVNKVGVQSSGFTNRLRVVLRYMHRYLMSNIPLFNVLYSILFATVSFTLAE